MNKPVFIIPIKGNSKRVEKKNLRRLYGIPLFFYTLNVAVRCNVLYQLNTDIYVSTESDEVIEAINHSHLCRNNVEILKRPKELSEDPNQIPDVCLYHLNNGLKDKYDILIMVQPSNPFIKEEDIFNCLKLYTEKARVTLEGVRSVKEIKTSTWLGDNDGERMTRYRKEDYNQRFYLGNGSIVIVDVKTLLKDKDFPNDYIPYIMNDGIDIDTEQDFFIAEQLKKKGG